MSTVTLHAERSVHASLVTVLLLVLAMLAGVVIGRSTRGIARQHAPAAAAPSTTAAPEPEAFATFQD